MCCLACIRYLQLDCDFNYSHFYLLSYYQYTAKCMNQLCCNWADLLVGDSSEIDLSYKLATLVPVLFGRFSYILWLLVCVCVYRVYYFQATYQQKSFYYRHKLHENGSSTVYYFQLGKLYVIPKLEYEICCILLIRISQCYVIL